VKKKKAILIVIIAAVLFIMLSLVSPKHESSFLRLGGSNISGMTDLHWAAWDGRTKAVEKLLAKGVDVNCRNKDGYTPLHYAALKGRNKTVELLIAKGADVNARENVDGGTPLHDAAGFGHVKVVELLLAAGADVNAKTKKGWTPLDCITNLLETTSRFDPIKIFKGRKLKACAELLREHAKKQRE